MRALLLSLWAGGAAACPVAGDLATGVSFVRADGTREEHRRIEAGIEIVTRDAAGRERARRVVDAVAPVLRAGHGGGGDVPIRRRIGACIYEVWRIAGPDGLVEFLPALGTGLRVGAPVVGLRW
ncbi:MAG: hypothetical protein ACU0CO_18630 [Shimia sp.]